MKLLVVILATQDEFDGLSIEPSNRRKEFHISSSERAKEFVRFSLGSLNANYRITYKQVSK